MRPVSGRWTDERLRVAEIDRWCASQLSRSDLDYVRGFRSTVEVALSDEHTLLCYHGSPHSFDDAITATTPSADLERMVSGCEATVMAGGHTHEQFVRRHKNSMVLNPGSVGLDRTGAGYALADSKEGILGIELRSLLLPAEKIRRTALESHMPHAEWWADFW